jgi:hypothetical protein
MANRRCPAKDEFLNSPGCQEPSLNARGKLRSALARTRRWVSGHHGVRFHDCNLFLGRPCFSLVLPGRSAGRSGGRCAPVAPRLRRRPPSQIQWHRPRTASSSRSASTTSTTTSGTVVITTLVAERLAVLCPNTQTRKSLSYQRATPQQGGTSWVQTARGPAYLV